MIRLFQAPFVDVLVLTIALFLGACTSSLKRAPGSAFGTLAPPPSYEYEVEVPIDDGSNVGGDATSAPSAEPLPVMAQYVRPAGAKAPKFQLGEDVQCGNYKELLRHNRADKLFGKPLSNVSEEALLRSIYDHGKIVIHHTVNGKSTSAKSVINYMMRPKSRGGRGWSDSGYHFLIDYSGKIHKGRSLGQLGAHVHNKTPEKKKLCRSQGSFPASIDKDFKAIGIALIGNFSSKSKSSSGISSFPVALAQKRSLRKLIKELKQRFKIKEVGGHKDYKHKDCPGGRVIASLKKMGLYRPPTKSRTHMDSAVPPFDGRTLKCKECRDYLSSNKRKARKSRRSR